MFFLLFLLDDRTMIERSGSGSIPLTNGSGSGTLVGNSVADPGCLSRIRILFFPSRIRIKEFKYFSLKNMVSELSEIWSGLLIPDLDPEFLHIPGPGSRGQKGTGSRIRIRNSGWKNISIVNLGSFVVSDAGWKNISIVNLNPFIVSLVSNNSSVAYPDSLDLDPGPGFHVQIKIFSQWKKERM